MVEKHKKREGLIEKIKRKKLEHDIKKGRVPDPYRTATHPTGTTTTTTTATTSSTGQPTFQQQQLHQQYPASVTSAGAGTAGAVGGGSGAGMMAHPSGTTTTATTATRVPPGGITSNQPPLTDKVTVTDRTPVDTTLGHGGGGSTMAATGLSTSIPSSASTSFPTFPNTATGGAGAGTVGGVGAGANKVEAARVSSSDHVLIDSTRKSSHSSTVPLGHNMMGTTSSIDSDRIMGMGQFPHNNDYNEMVRRQSSGDRLSSDLGNMSLNQSYRPSGGGPSSSFNQFDDYQQRQPLQQQQYSQPYLQQQQQQQPYRPLQQQQQLPKQYHMSPGDEEEDSMMRIPSSNRNYYQEGYENSDTIPLTGENSWLSSIIGSGYINTESADATIFVPVYNNYYRSSGDVGDINNTRESPLIHKTSGATPQTVGENVTPKYVPPTATTATTSTSAPTGTTSNLPTGTSTLPASSSSSYSSSSSSSIPATSIPSKSDIKNIETSSSHNLKNDNLANTDHHHHNIDSGSKSEERHDGTTIPR